MFRLNVQGRGLLLSQFNMADFVDSSWESLLFGRSGLEVELEVSEVNRSGGSNYGWNLK